MLSNNFLKTPNPIRTSNPDRNKLYFILLIVGVFLMLAAIIAVMKPVWQAKEQAVERKQEAKSSYDAEKEIEANMKAIEERRIEKEKNDTRTEEEKAGEIEANLKAIEERRIEKEENDPRTEEEKAAEIEANLKAIEERQNRN